MRHKYRCRPGQASGASAGPGPITTGGGLAKTRGYQLRATTSPWGNRSWLSPGRPWSVWPRRPDATRKAAATAP
ncbi:hypothetical protein BF49_0638 [Bradyrhizobium sp.]|nr:hypothetical protein BF49_0638 [Bradyrhizobium sp.]